MSANCVYRLLLATTLTTSCAVPTLVLAASSTAKPNGVSEQLQEIVVTAARQGATTVQSTPLAVTAFSGAQLAQIGVLNIAQLSQLAPSLVVAENPFGDQVYIRGIGNNNIYTGADPDVTMQVDGVYIARPYSQLTDFMDVGDVEVLRGPQGTLYGRNAVGGVINVVSKVPSNTFAADLAQSVGDYDYYQTQGYVSGPIVSDTLTASVAINYINHGPYIKNENVGSPGVDNANHGGIRTQLRWTPADWIDATTRMDYSQWSENQNGLVKLLTPASVAPLATSLIGDYGEVAINSPETIQQKVGGISEDINIRISRQLSLRSISAYRSSYFDQASEADATELAILSAYHYDKDRQVSQELDLQGHFDRLSFVSGLYYFHENDRGTQIAYIPPSIETPANKAAAAYAEPDMGTDSKAIFAEVNYEIVPTVKLIAGARYTDETKSVSQDYAKTTIASAPAGELPVLGNIVGAPFIASQQRDFSAFTPKGEITWEPTQDIMAYASVTKGFKSGGYNAAATSLVGFGYAPEKLVSYEAGVKSDWLDHRLRINLTGFHYDYSDLQVTSHVGAGLISISNAASARDNGAEVETAMRPLRGLELRANFSYIDAVYTSFPNYAVSGGIVGYVSGSSAYNPATGSYNATGNSLNGAPKYSGSVSGQYTHDLFAGDGYIRLQYYGQSREFFDATNAAVASQGRYGILNGGAGYRTEDGRWTMDFIISNITNAGYVSNLQVVPYHWVIGVPGDPRTFYFRLGRHW